MEQVLIRLANMSFQAGIVVCVVFVARILLAAIKAPKRYAYFLWFIPFFRMAVPVHLESVFSLLPRQTAQFDTSLLRVPDTGVLSFAVPDAGAAVSSVGADSAFTAKTAAEIAADAGMKAGMSADAAGGISLTILLCAVWIAGIAVLLLYGIFSCRKLKKIISCSVHAEDNIYFADHIAAPFVLGFVKPRIYLPSDLDENEMFYVLKHERAHIRRRDPLLKIAAFLIVCIHWFNPLAWAAFYYLGKDMELSCDETVLHELGADSRSAYAQVLLDLSAGTRSSSGGKLTFPALPLAFGEGNTKDRITNIMRYKKPLFVTAFIAVVLIVILAVGFLTDPKSDGGFADNGISETESTEMQAEPSYGPVPVKEPLIEDRGLTSSNDVILDYADKNTAIFHGPFGLFVYSMEKGSLIRSLDLQSIGCEKTEGADACEVSVSADGSTVYLLKHNFLTYIYNVEEHTLELTSDTYDDLYNQGVDLFEGLLQTRLCVQPDYTVLRSSNCVRVDDGGETCYIYMQSGSGMLADLCVYAERDEGIADYHVFGQETPPAEQEIPPAEETRKEYEQARQEALEIASELKTLETLEAQKTFLASLPNDIEQAKARDDLILRDEDINYGLWDAFYEDVQNQTPASLLFGGSTDEGDLIYTYLYYDGAKFYLLFDNTRDKLRGTGPEYEEAVYENLLVDQYRAPGQLKEYQVAVLNNDPSLSYEDCMNSWLSSTYPPDPIDYYPLIFREADY